MAARIRQFICLVTALSSAAFSPGTVAGQVGVEKATIKNLMRKLDALQADIDGLKTDLTAVKQGVAGVQREVVTCTVRAKRQGLCDRVRETKASACFDLSVLEAKLLARWIAEIKAKAEGGLGWADGPDGKIAVDARAPVAAVPSNFGLEIAPKLEMKGEICVEMPIEALPATGTVVGGPGAAKSRAAAAATDASDEALATRFEQIAATVVPLMMERVDSGMPDGDRIAAGVQAFESLGNGDLSVLHGDLLSDPLLMDALDVMPTPVMLKTAIQNPAALRNSIPALNGSVSQRAASLCDPQSGLSIVRSPLFSGASTQICNHLRSVPDFDGIAGQLLDIPEATAALVDGLLDKTQQVVKNTSNWFCSRPLFAGTKLCR